MAVKIKMYQHDLKPDFVVLCSRRPDPDVDAYLPVDLTPAVSIRAIGVRPDGSVVFDRSATGSAEGLVTMEWQPADTATVGIIKVEVEVMWPGNKPETFRPPEVYEIVADFA